MAKVVWSAGIDSVSGALSKPSKGGQHSCSKMVLATHRVAATTNPNCSRLYLRGLSSVTRSTQPSAGEYAARERFAAVARAVAIRKQDLTKMGPDKEAFLAQKDLPYGKKTMKSFLWALELEAYDESQQG